MQVVNYLFEPQYIVERFHYYQAVFEKRNPDKTYVTELPNITLRYLRREPTAYIRFGPYWGAVIKAMQACNKLITIENNESFILIDAYTIPDTDGIAGELLTLIAAFEFKEYYNENLFQGTREFEPFDELEFYTLHDPEFEMYVDCGMV